VGDHDTGDPQGVVEQADQAHQDTHGDGVLAGERLVVHEDLRVQGNRPGQCDAALHAAGELVGHQLDGTAQPHRLQLHQYDVADHLLGQAGMHAQRERDVLEHVEIGEQRAALEQHAHLLAHVEQLAAREARQVVPGHPDLAPGGHQLGGDQAQQGRLATAGRPHDGRDLASRNGDIDVVEDTPLPALEGHSLQLDGVVVAGAHLVSLHAVCETDGSRPHQDTFRHDRLRRRTIAPRR